jgi:hypothetical protein
MPSAFPQSKRRFWAKAGRAALFFCMMKSRAHKEARWLMGDPSADPRLPFGSDSSPISHGSSVTAQISKRTGRLSKPNISNPGISFPYFFSFSLPSVFLLFLSFIYLFYSISLCSLFFALYLLLFFLYFPPFFRNLFFFIFHNKASGMYC